MRGLGEVELLRVLSDIAAAETQNEGTISDAICGLPCGFPAEKSRALPDPSSGSSSGQPYILFLCTLSSCFVLVDIVEILSSFVFGSSGCSHCSLFFFARV